jgi:hypothetical protein
MKGRLRNVGFRKIILGVIVGVAALLFLVSMFSPFLDALLYGAEGSHYFLEGKVWSFRASFKIFYWDWMLPNGSYGVTSSVSTGERWFTDCWVFGMMPRNVTYWWGLAYWGEFAISISLLVFIDQILTLLFTTLSLLIRRFQWQLLLGAAVCGLFTILNMWAFSLEVADFHSYEAGFWLAVASDILLFAVSMTSSVWNLRK